MWWIALMTAQASSYYGCTYTGTVTSLTITEGSAAVELQVESSSGETCLELPGPKPEDVPRTATFTLTERHELVALAQDDIRQGHRISISRGRAMGYDGRGKPWVSNTVSIGRFAPPRADEASCWAAGAETLSGQRGPIDACNVATCLEGHWLPSPR